MVLSPLCPTKLNVPWLGPAPNEDTMLSPQALMMKSKSLACHDMCAVGEKLIRFPDNCGVGSYFVSPRDETQEYKYPEIIVTTSTEWYDNPEFIANWDAWKPAWLEEDRGNRMQEGYAPFIVKAPGVANWCAECNVMQAQPCYQFRCAACDNKQWPKDVMDDAWHAWRFYINYSEEELEEIQSMIAENKAKRQQQTLVIDAEPIEEELEEI